MSRFVTLAVGVLALALGARTGRPAPEPLASAGAGLDAVCWMQTSAEYRALARQTWRQVSLAVEAGLENPRVGACVEDRFLDLERPPALVVDVDETVLDNSPYQARLLREGASYDEASWSAWVREAAARPVPGALDALTRAAMRGVTIFYVTNRDAALEGPTRVNLRDWGFPLDARRDTVLTKGEREDWTSDKTSRRLAITKSHRVLALVGDDLNDFLPGARSERAERRELVEEHDVRWGRTWFMLPNPSYGSWERALVPGFERLPAEELEVLKLRSLDERRPRPAEAR